MRRVYMDVGLDNKITLWNKYQSLVRKEVLRLQKRLPASIEFDDLIQAGAIGFISAVDSFDARKGVALSAWITQRIKWALMDELRDRDWVPRRIRKHSREISALIQKLEQENGRNASEMEIAERMGVPLCEFQQMLADTNSIQILSIDELQESYDDLWEQPDDENALLDPVHQSIKNNLALRIAEHIASIPEREQRILQFYYHYDLNMHDIALILNVTETRVSQLHSLAIKRLRRRMDRDYTM
ncbi:MULTISPECIES: RNA polymerase sigma factor FliA [Pantoea]|uniref:Flagellar biosynthesis sigma factor n=2 Tax=Pantoea TaxID=53335 RepID=A0A0U3K2F9_9GAMM|nr:MULTISPECIES: RNA polymerase sigma factor FliA [Pantoea]ALV93580.1 flagellar biosynthesis sigma factor [Pantoea vagans]KHJ69945.1 flagellar biosynthesis sigma factor [Pantoea rodasii]